MVTSLFMSYSGWLLSAGLAQLLAQFFPLAVRFPSHGGVTILSAEHLPDLVVRLAYCALHCHGGRQPSGSCVLDMLSLLDKYLLLYQLELSPVTLKR
jgi:hypothetical protein